MTERKAVRREREFERKRLNDCLAAPGTLGRHSGAAGPASWGAVVAGALSKAFRRFRVVAKKLGP